MRPAGWLTALTRTWDRHELAADADGDLGVLLDPVGRGPVRLLRMKRNNDKNIFTKTTKNLTRLRNQRRRTPLNLT